eukprot:1150115-Pelagomonas_calceolata.AAC.2
MRARSPSSSDAKILVESSCYCVGQVLWLCEMLCRGHLNGEASSSQHICRPYCKYMFATGTWLVTHRLLLCVGCLQDMLAIKRLDLDAIELSHRHVTEPWPSARRATARRRSPNRILVAGVEIKMPSIGGSQWEALSLMHAAERQA